MYLAKILMQGCQAPTIVPLGSAGHALCREELLEGQPSQSLPGEGKCC